MDDLLILIPLLPLLAAVINYTFGRLYFRNWTHYPAIAAVGISWIISLAVFIDQADHGDPLFQHLYTWIPAGQFEVPLNLYVDHLTSIMLLVVTTVSLLVHIYSVGYMKGDGGYYRFFSFLPLFVFSMLMLVLADNFVVLFFGWEAVGVCSYLLIGFYFKRHSANQAAKKAFIVNRIGDFGFGLGIFLIFSELGTVMFNEVFAEIDTLSTGTISIIALLLFAGAVGKSAQIPLHVWLPDAMEGPTPVSALIHAATMVTAGVYMVAQMYPIFVLSYWWILDLMAIVGVLTALVAGTIGLTQHDIKRVIAYSTLSHLGFMIFALGVGAWVAAVFHLITHAFFKGLLFLGSGSVIHAMDEEQDMRKMGGLKKYMPITYWTFLIAALANAGVFPLSGFWSKDEIIAGAWLDGQTATMAVVIIAALFSSLYMFRVVFLTFHGEERFDSSRLHPHESPWIMTIPLILLAIPAAFLGPLDIPPEEGWLHDYLIPEFSQNGSEGHAIAAVSSFAQEAEAEVHEPNDSITITFAIISSIMAVGGFIIMYLAYIRKSPIFSPTLWAERTGVVYRFFLNKYYFDEVYEYVVIHPLYWISDRVLWRIVDIEIIDGTVNGIASGTQWSSGKLRRVQTGFVANYALAIALGAVIIIGVYFLIESDLVI